MTTLDIHIRVSIGAWAGIHHFTWSFGWTSVIHMILRGVQVCVVVSTVNHWTFQIQVLTILYNILNNIFLNNLSFVSVMTRILLILNLNWIFLFTSSARRWSQKFLRGVISDDYVFLKSSIWSFTIFINFGLFESTT